MPEREEVTMRKDTYLVNIYLKIHNKKTLTLDDLRYLAKYAPECFEKTCKNVVYNIPEAKTVMEPQLPTVQERGEIEQHSKALELPAVPKRQKIERILENIRQLETRELPLVGVEADEVKSLLGNLYMELLFPHNDKDTFFDTTGEGEAVSIDFRV